MGTRATRSKEKNLQYDAVYYLRNREKLLPEMRGRANTPEQKLYRQLYARWRQAVKGTKVPIDEPFDKPTKEDRILILEKKSNGCEKCGTRQDLELDHKDGYPNNNKRENLRWLCSACHKQETAKSRGSGSFSEYSALAKKKSYTRK